MPTLQPGTSWIVDAIRRREAELADACANAAALVKDTRVAGKLVELVFEHVQHSGPRLSCTHSGAPAVDAGALRRRAQRPLALCDHALEAAVDLAVAGAVARSHAEVALFIDDICSSLLVSPADRERLLRIAHCTAALGDSLRPGPP